jgi:hypothetical protein
VATPQDDPTRRLLAPKKLRSPAAASGTAKRPARPSSRPGRTLLALAAVALLALPVGWMAWRAGSGDTTGGAAPSATSAVPAVSAVAESVAPSAIEPVASPARAPSAQGVADSTAKAPSSGPAPAAEPAAAHAAVPLAGIDEMLASPAVAHWRAWRFKGNPAVLVIEFPSLHDQGMAMNRMAALFEKRNAPRDRVLNDSELAALVKGSGDSTASFYQGHDYPAAKVARFFTLAAASQTALNAQERQLLDKLQHAGLITGDARSGYSAAGMQAVVSFTALQADDPTTAADEQIDPVRRKAVLLHELSHGEFFTNPSYEAHSKAFWSRRLSAQERAIWKKYLGGLDYDPADLDLMANETQAMLMHTPDPRAFNASALGVSDAALASMRARFRTGEPTHGMSTASR